MLQRRFKHKPTFLWEGLLIILPVMIMSVVGFITIRQDRSVVEAEVRRSADQLADQLASALAKRLPAHLALCDVFSETWSKHQQNTAMAGRRAALGIDEVSTQLKEWRSFYPGLNPEEVLPNR